MDTKNIEIKVGDRVLYQGIGINKEGEEFILGSSLMREVTHVLQHDDGILFRGKGSRSRETIDIFSTDPIVDGEIQNATEVVRWNDRAIWTSPMPCARIRVTVQ